MALDKRTLLIASSLGIAAFSSLFIFSMVQRAQQQVDQEKKAIEEQKKSSAPKQRSYAVLVALKDIPEGTTVTSEYVGTKELPEQYIQEGAMPASVNILGKVASAPVYAGQQIVAKSVAEKPKPKLITDITPPGKRAVPLVIDNMSSLNDLLHPGDYVDVLSVITPPEGSSLYALSQDNAGTSMTGGDKSASKMVTLPLFQNVLVLSVGSDMGGGPAASVTAAKGKNSFSNSVTLALTPQEAAMASFVAEQGKIRIMMRSNSDLDQATIKPVNWDTLFDYMYPQARERGAKAPVTVEIYRGLQKDIVPLSEGKSK
jgi:pilus assembly protein CpaB